MNKMYYNKYNLFKVNKNQHIQKMQLEIICFCNKQIGSQKYIKISAYKIHIKAIMFRS